MMSNPSKFEPSFCKQARKLGMLGLTDLQMARFFEVADSTFSDWKVKHPEFKQALRSGKDEADTKVVHALYINATRKMNPTAQIFWLKNRRPDLWRDRHELTGAGGGPVELADATDMQAARVLAFALETAGRAVDKARKSGNEAAKTKENA